MTEIDLVTCLICITRCAGTYNVEDFVIDFDCIGNPSKYCYYHIWGEKIEEGKEEM